MARSSKSKPPQPVIQIITDTREQRPFPIPEAVRGTLRTGDYGVALDGQLLPIAIERKSVADLLGCIGGGREAFKRELERAKALAYFAIVIEGTRHAVIEYVKERRELGGRLAISHVMGSLAAWDVRGVHVHFEENRLLAAAWTRQLLLKFASDWAALHAVGTN